MMPARETVAGVAKLRSRISKIILMWGFRGMRSLEARVRILLSSITLFIDSIQFASKSPSRMIHLGLVSGMVPSDRIVLESSPSFHSRVAMLTHPYSSSDVIDLGLMSTQVVFLPALSWLLPSIFHTDDLPAPAAPMTKTQWRICSSSSSWMILRTKSGSGLRPDSTHVFSTTASNSMFLCRGGSTPGKRSVKRPVKMTRSSATILAMLVSRSALISRACSARSGSARLKAPATTNTDLMALRPQS
mmetsp:Transcript_12959/g.30930  ORF Transcript_12959/g.30930 Transcript_12959/m.30930 type:complete len:246 (+) Transcript_12959:1511-2248(+)